jgi:hypothetical protein
MSEKSNNVPADFLCISFAESEKPTYKEKRGDGYIEFGNKNDYPLYLNMLYSDSAKHNAIVGGKVKYISGNGFVLEEESDVKGLAFLENPNTKETLNDILPKVSTDIEVFGGSYIEVIWGKASNMIAEITTMTTRSTEPTRIIHNFGLKRIGQTAKYCLRCITLSIRTYHKASKYFF